MIGMYIQISMHTVFKYMRNKPVISIHKNEIDFANEFLQNIVSAISVC